MHISMVGIFVLNFYIHYKLVNTGVSAALHSARLVAGGWWGAVTDALIIGLGENALSCEFFCTNAIR